MGIEFNIKSNGDLLHVVARGNDDNLQDVQNYQMAIIQHGLKNNTRYVLCDERDLEYRLNTFDIYESAKYVSEYAPKFVRIALVFNKKYAKDISFFEDVVVNRGLMMRVFDDIDKAKKWLLPNALLF